MIRKRKSTNIKIIMAILILIASLGAIIVSTYFLYRVSYPKKYSNYVEKYSESFNIDQNLTYSVIRSESRFNKSSVSQIGARGLMQITEETFDWAKMKLDDKDEWEYKDIYEPEVNIKYGTFILSLLMKEFENEKTVIAAYHAGWGSVKGWLKDKEHSANGTEIDNIPFNNTNAYVVQVVKTKKIYEKLYN